MDRATETRGNRRYQFGRAAADKAHAGQTGQGATRLGHHKQPCFLSFCARPECRGFLDRSKELADG